MADYNAFNPNVPQVNPGDYDVTRPISQPEANKGLGTLFAGVGNALKEGGQLVQDTTKLIDYTNKEDLSNKISLDLNAQRDRHITDLEGQNNSLLSGNAPVGLQGLPGKVNNLAAAKAQNKVDDVYFRGRIDDLSKQYRAAYPAYRDFIDKTFEKAGFGQPANAYMSALERANQGLEAALGQNKSKTLDMLYTHGKEINNVAGLIDDLQSGRKTESQVNAIAMPQLKAHFDTEQRQRQFGLEASDQKNKESQAIKLVTDNASQDLATTMNLPAVKAIISRMEAGANDPKSIDENQSLADANYLAFLRTGLKTKAITRDSREHSFFTLDANGQEVETGKSYRNNSILGDAYPTLVDKVHQPLTDIIQRLAGNKDLGMAAATSNMVASSFDEYAKRVFGGQYGQIFQAANFAEKYAPVWWKDFLNVAVKNSQGEVMTKAQQALFNGSVWPVFAPNPPPITGQIQKLNNAGVNDPAINKTLLITAPLTLTHPAAPPEIKQNVVESYFKPDNPSVFDFMKNNDRSKYFAAMTSADVVSNVSKLPPASQEQYFSRVTSEFNKSLGSELGALPSFAQRGGTASTPFRIHWDDERHRFGIDVSGHTNLQDMDETQLNKINWRAVHGGPPGYSNSGEIKTITGVVKRINTGLGGLSNIAKATNIDVNGYLVHQMQNAGLEDNKFWDAVKTQATSRKKDQAQAKTE